MEIIKQTIAYLNPGQTAVDVCDQPVFALTKKIQWRYQEKSGSDSYFCLSGGLHFKQCMLTIHGGLIKGSSLENILLDIDMSIIGTGALVHGNHMKQVRYCLQVSLSALFLKLKDAKDKSGSTLSSLEWLEQLKNQNEMCLYWYLIVTLQADILLYARYLQESNYKLLVHAMKNSFDHYNYA